MKRLFEVVVNHKPLTPREFFPNKEDAKVFRDDMNAQVRVTSGGTAATFTIVRGPDHERFTVRGNARTHSHNNRSGGSGGGFKKGGRK